jgi:hypothetical protein
MTLQGEIEIGEIMKDLPELERQVLASILRDAIDMAQFNANLMHATDAERTMSQQRIYVAMHILSMIEEED